MKGSVTDTVLTVSVRVIITPPTPTSGANDVFFGMMTEVVKRG